MTHYLIFEELVLPLSAGLGATAFATLLVGEVGNAVLFLLGAIPAAGMGGEGGEEEGHGEGEERQEEVGGGKSVHGELAMVERWLSNG